MLQHALTKRFLEVVDMWQVRSIATQRLSARRDAVLLAASSLWPWPTRPDDCLPQVPYFWTTCQDPITPCLLHLPGLARMFCNLWIWKLLSVLVSFKFTPKGYCLCIASPSVHVVSRAMDCSTKSCIRGIPLPGGRGPAPPRSSRYLREAGDQVCC